MCYLRKSNMVSKQLLHLPEEKNMLNILYFTREQKGFILPFVLFILTLIMLIVISGIQIYKNNIQLTHQHVEQLKIETLFQSAYTLFQQELLEGEVILPEFSNRNELKTYPFPDGEVIVIAYLVEEETNFNQGHDPPLHHLTFRVITDEYTYSFLNIPVPEAEDNYQ